MRLSQSCGRIRARLLSPATELRASPALMCFSCGKARGPTQSIGERCSAGPHGLAAKNDCDQHRTKTASPRRFGAVHHVCSAGSRSARGGPGGLSLTPGCRCGGSHIWCQQPPGDTSPAAPQPPRAPRGGNGYTGRGRTGCTLLWGNATTAFRWKREVCANCYHCHSKKGLLWHSHLVW